jgi:single-stranded-DNA-specific exonuclease
MSTHKILNIATPDIPLQDKLSKEVDISAILAQILINRGIKTAPEAVRFLDVKLEHLLDPYDFSDMPRAVRLIQKAIAEKKKIMLCGDYDVDGITSLAILKSTLTRMKADVIHYLPHRIKEGYGLNKNILKLAKEKKISLLITADCGISNHAEVKELRGHGIDVIITDHHEPQANLLPPATSIINPKVKNSGYKYRDLAGVGVVYKLCQALTAKPLFEELDLVSLGTIADVAPLTGENRIIAKEGLNRLSKTSRPGLRALMEASGIQDKKMIAGFVSFILGPRLNASGRMDTAETALNLLLSEEEAEAAGLAKIIQQHNRERQKIEGKIMEEAEDLINREINFKEHKVIVIAKENWHEGVLGIVASKLADRFYRPAIVISLNEGLCRGSGRSIEKFHLFNALLDCKDVLENFGGHAHAAGLVIARDSIEDFKEQINRLAKERLLLEDLIPRLDIDMEVSFSDWDTQTVVGLEFLEPYGAKNPEPLFITRNLRPKGDSQVLGKNTLKFWATDGDITYQAIGFGMGDLEASLTNCASLDLVYTPRIDTWQGEENMLLEVRDIFFR